MEAEGGRIGKTLGDAEGSIVRSRVAELRLADLDAIPKQRERCQCRVKAKSRRYIPTDLNLRSIGIDGDGDVGNGNENGIRGGR